MYDRDPFMSRLPADILAARISSSIIPEVIDSEDGTQAQPNEFKASMMAALGQTKAETGKATIQQAEYHIGSQCC
jgi:hypothetical protein